MTAKDFIQGFLPGTDSPGKIYELFRGLGYPGDKVLDPTYQRKTEEFELAREEKEVDFMCRRSLVEYLANYFNSPLSRGDRGVSP